MPAPSTEQPRGPSPLAQARRGAARIYRGNHPAGPPYPRVRRRCPRKTQSNSFTQGRPHFLGRAPAVSTCFDLQSELQDSTRGRGAGGGPGPATGLNRFSTEVAPRFLARGGPAVEHDGEVPSQFFRARARGFDLQSELQDSTRGRGSAGAGNRFEPVFRGSSPAVMTRGGPAVEHDVEEKPQTMGRRCFGIFTGKCSGVATGYTQETAGATH